MDATAPPDGATRLKVLAMAATAALLVTIVAGYLTRLHIFASAACVSASGQVKLTLAHCETAVARSDWKSLRAEEAVLAGLTAAIPSLRARAVQAMSAADDDAAIPVLEASFASMRSDEDRLFASRLAALEADRLRSATVFVVGAVVAGLSGIATFLLVFAQRDSLGQAKHEAARSAALFAAIIETVPQGIIAIDSARKAIAMNAAAHSIVGEHFPWDEWPRGWRAHIDAKRESGDSLSPEEGPLARAVRGEPCENVVCRIAAARDSASRWVSMTAQPIKDEEGKIAGAVLTLHDITEQQASAKRLRDLSATDELTGLLNRRGFLEFARPKIDAARQEKQPVGLLFADMNGLKRINDELGHDQGDRAIADAAAVLRGVFRDGDVIARLGGDEFVALLPNMPPTAGEALLSRLAASVRAHSGANVRPYRLSLSAGVTFFDWSADDALEGVLARADQLMYQRKRTRASLSAIRLPEGGT